MNVRILTGLLLASTAPQAFAQGWLFSLDVPATAGVQYVAAGQTIRVDDGDASLTAFDSGLPPAARPGALARDPGGATCWSPDIPVDLPDGQFARPDELYCHLDGTFTRIFRGGDFGLPRGTVITSAGWNAAEQLHLSFALPVSVAGVLVRPGTRVRVDGSALLPVPDMPDLPARTARSAGSFDEQDRSVLALTAPAGLAGAFGSGLIVFVNDAGSVSSDDTLAALFDDSRRIGLSGLHRLLPEAVEDFLFSDRFEAH